MEKFEHYGIMGEKKKLGETQFHMMPKGDHHEFVIKDKKVGKDMPDWDLK